MISTSMRECCSWWTASRLLDVRLRLSRLQRRMDRIDKIVIGLYAHGMSDACSTRAPWRHRLRKFIGDAVMAVFGITTKAM
jgi:class 3 adenylate cyclase